MPIILAHLRAPSSKINSAAWRCVLDNGNADATVESSFDAAVMRLEELTALAALLADDSGVRAFGNLDDGDRGALFCLFERLARGANAALLRSIGTRCA
jgi:hypothetical protein